MPVNRYFTHPARRRTPPQPGRAGPSRAEWRGGRAQVWALDRRDGHVTLETREGACRDFLRGTCRRSADCKFDHACAACWHPGAPPPPGLGAAQPVPGPPAGAA